MRKESVLFLCTGNSARSQMAEAFLRYYAGDQYNVFSAGFEARGIHLMTTHVMGEVNLDITHHRSKPVREYMGFERFDYVIIVCRRADENCPTVFADARYRFRWLFDDPVKAGGTDEEKLAIFRNVRDQIEARVKLWIAEKNEERWIEDNIPHANAS